MSSLANRVRMLAMRKRLRDAYAKLFASPEGRLVLRDLMTAGGVLSVAHEPGDPCSTAFNDGRRSLALHVLERLRWSEAEMEMLAQDRTEAAMSEMGKAAHAADD